MAALDASVRSLTLPPVRSLSYSASALPSNVQLTGPPNSSFTSPSSTFSPDTFHWFSPPLTVPTVCLPSAVFTSITAARDMPV